MAFDRDQYELLDFGDGRKLERFGGRLVDRPAPAAARGPRAHPLAWRAEKMAFAPNRAAPGDLGEAERAGVWTGASTDNPPWVARHAAGVFALRAGPRGQVGLFPEQADNWEWLLARGAGLPRGWRALNLFAYTGGATLALARAGAAVAHVDAARGSVAWARRNAALSGLADAPIRWIVDDARKFVARETRRGRGYHAVVLDPPTYGHGAGGETWRVDADLIELLRGCAALLTERPGLALLTCHSPGWGPAELAAALAGAWPRAAGGESFELSLRTAEGRGLPAGACCRAWWG